MISRTARKRRAGFALLLVVGFNVVLLAVWSVAYRSVGSALQVEMTRSLRRTRDNGTMTALGQGVALLRYNLPTKADHSSWTAGETYICSVQLDLTPPKSTYGGYLPDSPTPPANLRWFEVTYKVLSVVNTKTVIWSVQAQKADSGGTLTMPQPTQAFTPQP